MNAIAFLSEREPRAPMVAPEVTMRGMDFMALHYLRLRKSIAWLRAKRKPEIGFYMMNLWGTAFYETPAGSLENDDDALADAAMCSPERWAAVRDDVLHGWERCGDGRLYSRFLADVVNEAWARRMSHATRGAEGAAKRWARVENGGRRDAPCPPVEAPPRADTDAMPTRTHSRAMAEPKPSDSCEWDKDKDKDKEKEGLSLPLSVPAKAAAPTRSRAGRVAKQDEPEGFNEFWAAYPNGAAKKEARLAWPKAVKTVGGDWRVLVAAAERYAAQVAGRDPSRVKHASGWLNGERWSDAAPAKPRDAFAEALGFGDAGDPGPMPDPDWPGAVIDGEATEAPEPQRLSARELLEAEGVPL